jgi:hypothetical protein
MRVARPHLEPMPAAYSGHLERAIAHFTGDHRVLAMWLTGAVARRAQDAGSDLDLCLTVADDALEAMVDTHEDWIRDLVRPVSVQRMGTVTGWYVLTDTCERIDVVLEALSELPSTSTTRRVALFDRAGCAEMLPPVEDPGPDRRVIASCIHEALRQMANFPIVFVRQDWLLGVVAVQQLHHFLYELYAQANRPRPPTGPKQWSSKLDPGHRRLLEQLPVPQAEPTSIIAAHRRAVDLFETTAPAIASANDVAWPHELHRAVRDFRAAAYPPQWHSL